MKKGSIKNTRINAEVRKEIQSILMNGLKDPRVSPMTTVTDARGSRRADPGGAQKGFRIHPE